MKKEGARASVSWYSSLALSFAPLSSSTTHTTAGITNAGRRWMQFSTHFAIHSHTVPATLTVNPPNCTTHTLLGGATIEGCLGVRESATDSVVRETQLQEANTNGGSFFLASGRASQR